MLFAYNGKSVGSFSFYSYFKTTAEGAQQLIPQSDLQHADKSSTADKPGLWPLIVYFLKLGTVGFGGPVALVGFMHRDLVEQRSWIMEDTYKLSLALAQIMPGPLAAQVAIAICYFEAGVLGATLGGLAFVLPSFVMVVAISRLPILAMAVSGGCRPSSMPSVPRSSRSSRLPPTSSHAAPTSVTPIMGYFRRAHCGHHVGSSRAC